MENNVPNNIPDVTQETSSGIVEPVMVNPEPEKPKSKKLIWIIIIGLILLIGGFGTYYYLSHEDDTKKPEIKEEKPKKEIEEEKEIETEVSRKKSSNKYAINSNELGDFDLFFLKNSASEKTNMTYSPLSIKYALTMLSDGANGKTKEQIDNILSDFKVPVYSYSRNMSFANAFFIRDSFKSNINKSYIEKISHDYKASVIFDSFESPDNINGWISSKTHYMIWDMFNDLSDYDFILNNSLAIDMEWINVLQNTQTDYSVYYPHERYSRYVPSLTNDYAHFDFEGQETQATLIDVSVNKYDIITELGESNIRKTVGDAYKEWLIENEEPYSEDIVDTYLDRYIEEIGSNYERIDNSTDLSFYSDDNVKVFKKSLKQYGNTTLEYYGIMPKTSSLDAYLKDVDSVKINNLINQVKDIELSSFKDGVITNIMATIPTFSIDYELDVKENLMGLGITDVFDREKADLSGISSATNTFIEDSKQRVKLEFSNEGIKAAAAIQMGGGGSDTTGFDYIYEVPVEVINLTFDKPFMFIIKEKDKGNIWFAGKVYSGDTYEELEW